MATFVTKNDGSRIAYDVEKIKHGVMSAAMEAELSEEEAEKIAEEISASISATFEGVEEVSTTEIREKILSELDATHPVVSEAWRKYEEGKHE
jgi:transcriptional regulator NrdR family protein